MMVTKKKYDTIKKHLEDIYEDLFDDSLENIIETLNHFKTKYPDYHSLRIDYDRYDHNGVLYGSRLETDKEYDKRQGKEAKQRAWRAKETARVNENKEATDLKEYERLKKKFE